MSKQLFQTNIRGTLRYIWLYHRMGATHTHKKRKSAYLFLSLLSLARGTVATQVFSLGVWRQQTAVNMQSDTATSQFIKPTSEG